MRLKILSYIITASLTLPILIGTAEAVYTDSETASMSMTTGWVGMQLSEVAGDGLMPVMNVNVVNESSLNADLWLENISRQNNSAENELSDLSGINGGGDTGDVIFEVTYKGGITSVILNDVDQLDTPLLLLEGMEPGSDALVTIRQNTTVQPDVIQESLTEDSPPNGYHEQLSVLVPYIFEFILKSGTFTSLPGESVFTLAKFFEAETDVLMTELDETPPTQDPGETSADNPADPSDTPVEALPEKTVGPTAETSVDDPADPSDTSVEAQPENTTEPTAETVVPEPTVAAVPQPEEQEETAAEPSKSDLSEYEG